MSKKVVWITGFVLVLCLALLGFQITRYVSSKSEKKNGRMETIEAKLEEANHKLVEKEQKKQSLEEEKAWKIEVYNTWKKAVNP